MSQLALVATKKVGVTVMEMGGKKRFIENVTGEWTVKKLKLAVQDYTGLHWESMRMLYKANILQPDEKLLSHYNIQPDHVIVLVERPVGGSKATNINYRI